MTHLTTIKEALAEVCTIYECYAENNTALPYGVIENISSEELSSRPLNCLSTARKISAQIMLNARTLEQAKKLAFECYNILDANRNLEDIYLITADYPQFNSFRNVQSTDSVYQALVAFEYIIKS